MSAPSSPSPQESAAIAFFKNLPCPIPGSEFPTITQTPTIPKIIHQIWIGGNTEQEPPTEFMKTWREKNPEWEYILWNEQEIAKRYPQGIRNQKRFLEMEELCGRADILRYEILYDYGGVYIDADSVCITPLDERFLKHTDCWAALENERLRGNLVANGTIGAIRGSKIMERCIQEISAKPTVSTHQTALRAWILVGPLFFTKVIASFVGTPNQMHIYPSHFFYPNHYSGLKYQGNDTVFGNHIWQSPRHS